jgi:hypothetical protein
MTSNYTKTKSSFTLLAFVALAFLVVVTAGAFAVAAGATAGSFGVVGPATFMQSMMGFGAGVGLGGAGAAGGLLTMGAVVGVAAIEAAAVLAVGLAVGVGSPTGVTSGIYTGARSGFEVPEIPNSDAGRSIYNGLKGAFDDKPINAMGVRAVSEGLFGTNCAPGALSSTCANSGLVPRADTGVESNNVQFWKDNGRPMLISGPNVPSN